MEFIYKRIFHYENYQMIQNYNFHSDFLQRIKICTVLCRWYLLQILRSSLTLKINFFTFLFSFRLVLKI